MSRSGGTAVAVCNEIASSASGLAVSANVLPGRDESFLGAAFSSRLAGFGVVFGADDSPEKRMLL